jgi:hypothetical protein
MTDVPWWLARWGVTGTWAQHIAWGSDGGVDYGAPPGTLILAASDGVVSYRVMTDGSSVARVTRPDGTATEMLHGIPRGVRRTVKKNDVIATSDGRRGVWGAGRSSGAHIHAHDRNKYGTRRPPFSTIPSGGGGAAGGGGTPINDSDEETLMRARSKESGTWYIIPELAPPTGIPTGASGSANHDRALAYNAAFGSGFPDLTSKQIQVLLEDNATRRKGFFAEQGAAAGLDAAAISAGLARIEAELEEIKAQEAAEAATYVAEVEAALADDFAAVHANIDGQGYTVTPT